jgi:hypothetical protein
MHWQIIIIGYGMFFAAAASRLATVTQGTAASDDSEIMIIESESESCQCPRRGRGGPGQQ